MGQAQHKIYAATSDPQPASESGDDLQQQHQKQHQRLSFHAAGGAIHSTLPSTTATLTTPLGSPSSAMLDWVRRPRRTLLQRVVRPLQRRYRRLPWTSRETVSVAVTLASTLYILVSVPLRVGFFYDPLHAAARTHEWTRALSLFSTLDVVSDALGIVQFLDLYHMYKDAFSQLAQSVSFEVGKKLAKKALQSHADNKPKMSTRNRATVSVRSSQAQWTLATIAPAAAAASASAQSAKAQRRRKQLVLALELVALLPLELVVVASNQYNLIHVLRATKLCRAHRVAECLDKLSRIYGQQRWVQTLSLTGIATLARNIALGVGLCHWAACGYMWIAHRTCGLHQELCNPAIVSSWVIKDRLMGASVARKYARALYWAARTLVVLGYDDATPISDGEILYGLFVQLCGALLSTSLLATFLFLFRHRERKQAAFNAHVDNAREYMRSQNLPRAVRRQVRAYFSYAWATHRSLDGEHALHLLPSHLESKIVSTLKASRVKQVCFLMRESVEFINRLALALVRRVYIPGDAIMEPKINAKMFFVIRGTVRLAALDGSRAKECQTGDFFADACLLCPDKYEETATAKTFCELYVLDKAAFDAAVAHFYRGKELETRARMAATLERYATQLRKTKQLLGLRGAEDTDAAVAVATSPSPSRGGGSRTVLSARSWRLPGSSFCIHWDTLRLLATVFVAFEVPYYTVFVSNHDAQKHFNVTHDTDARFVVALLVELFFACDLALRCRFFAYLDPVVMLTVVDPAMIFSVYKTNGFYLDLLAVLPVAMAMESFDGVPEDYSWVFRVLRLLRLRCVGELLQDITDFYSVSSKLQLILALLLGVTLTLHMVACLWFEMAWIPLRAGAPQPTHGVLADMSRQQCLEMATRFDNCSWVRYDCYGNLGAALPFESPHSRYQVAFAYIRSIYWAVVALTGVGYGDIVAFSTAESYFAAVWIYVSGILNFGIVGAMSSTIANLLAPQHHHVDRLNTLNALMAHLCISEALRGEIRRFYHHQFKTRKNAYESQLLRHLPDQLCYQISSLLHAEAARRVPLFDLASREFLEEVTGKFRHRTFQNGETLCIEGDICKEFFVLSHGKANAFQSSLAACPVGALEGGACYGVSAFLLARAHPVSLVAASPIHASVMTRDHFDGVLRKFHDEMADLTDEAEDAWGDDMARQKVIASNLTTRPKLKPHALSTPSLFYQKDQLVASSSAVHHHASWSWSGWWSSSSLSGRRDADAMRSSLQGVWNLGLTLWNIYNAFKIVFRIAFHAHIHASVADFRSFAIVDLLCDAYYAADIYLKLFYFDCDEVGLDNLVTRAETNAAYRTSHRFKRDLLASLPLYYMSEAAPLASALCRLPRLLRCLDLWAFIDETIILIQQTFASKNISEYLGPLKLLFFLLLGVHYAACVFFLISDHECRDDPSHCWLTHDHILHYYNHSLMALYVRCFYWALTSLTLVGSREIVSRDILGTLWATATCLGTTFIMGFILGELSELILDMDKQAKKYKERVDSFERFAKTHGLSETLQSRVGFFLKAQFEHAEGSELSETVHDLSANLKLKLLHEIYGATIAKLPISQFLSKAQVNNLALRLQTELFIPGDDIVAEHTFGTRLCVMRTGIAAVLWSESASSVALLMEGCLFGEIGFFLPAQRRLATVKATTSCEVLHISKHAWSELWSGGGDDGSSSVQQYALHAILGWVRARLLSYQESALTVAKRINRELMQRRILANLNGMMASPSAKAADALKRSLKRRSSFLTPERQVLEKKAKYLLARAEKHARRLEHMLVRHSHSGGPGGPGGPGGGGNTTRSTNWDALRSRQPREHVTPTGSAHRKKSLKTVDLTFNQFYVDVNPVNKHVAPHLDDHHMRILENESWRRFRYMATLQHAVSELMEELTQRQSTITAPAKTRNPVTTNATAPAPHRSSLLMLTGQRQTLSALKAPSIPTSQRLRPAHTDDHVGLKHGLAVRTDAHQQQHVHERLFTTTHAAPQPTELPSKRIESQQQGRFLLTRAVLADPRPAFSSERTERGAMLRRLNRCHSLPHFDRRYFAGVKQHEERAISSRHGDNGVVAMESQLAANVGITFDILQRSRRSKLSTLYQVYCRFDRWRSGTAASSDSTRDSPETDRIQRPASGGANKGNGWSMLISTLQLLRPRALGSKYSSTSHSPTKIHGESESEATTDAKDEGFRALVRQCSKAWDLLLLLIALYHALITPLKVCFRHDLQLLHALKFWSAAEYAMDALCVADVGVRLRRSRSQLEHARSGHHNHNHPHQSRMARLLASLSGSMPPHYDGFALDVIAVLPLELAALAVDGVGHWNHLPYSDKWLRLSFWRLNKVLLTRHTPALCESVTQFALYDLKLPISEAHLKFVRSLGSFVLMGHWMAVMWFAVSEKAAELFPASWLAFPGMLTFAVDAAASSSPPPTSAAAGGHRQLSSSSAHGSPSFDLSSVSLSRKFLRSMHFSFNSITTLWYGDIGSFNLLELLVEMSFILWSIYIYGVLVGAHGELLEAHSRREALFEQNLAELQHYLLQNNVPKQLKKQIKQYYASIWRRRKGEGEFAAVVGISPALHEDVVFATLHRFAWKVSIFRSLDVHFLRALLVKLQYVVCSENEEVVIRGDVDRSMYIISEGRILVKHAKSETTKETGDFFGELALLYGIPRCETCIALTVAELYRLDEQPYEELLLEFPEYSAQNRAAWTTTEPPPSPLTTLLHAQSLSAAVKTLLAGSSGRTAPVAPGAGNSSAISASAILDGEVGRSFVFKSALELLAQFGDVDSLQAKHIIHRAKAGARKLLKRAMGLETARGDGSVELDEGSGSDDGAYSHPQSSTLSSKQRRRRSSLRADMVREFTPRLESSTRLDEVT